MISSTLNIFPMVLQKMAHDNLLQISDDNLIINMDQSNSDSFSDDTIESLPQFFFTKPTVQIPKDNPEVHDLKPMGGDQQASQVSPPQAHNYSSSIRFSIFTIDDIPPSRKIYQTRFSSAWKESLREEIKYDLDHAGPIH